MHKPAFVTVAVAVTTVAAGAGILVTHSTSSSAHSTSRPKPYTTHLAAGLPVEPFVFVETAPGASTVRRARSTDPRSTHLYGAAVGSAIKDGYFFDPTSVFAKGTDLGLTLGQWLGASGSAQVSCDGNRAVMTSTFSGLVPKGVYTLWEVDLGDRPGPDGTPTMDGMAPLGPSGRDNVVDADSHGQAHSTVHLGFCPATRGTKTVASLAYHWDGKTYGDMPAPQPPGILEGDQLLVFLN